MTFYSRRDFLKLSVMGAGGLVVAACTQPTPETTLPTPPDASVALSGFQAFGATLKTRQDKQYIYVESNGLPDHPMMIGIKSWQQQVPLPQPYTGRNAWAIPLQPVLAAKPISAKTALYRGAIALAVNGVPIFNALNNRGEDALLAGELDQWGGHAGRADDYHYHTAPLHLQAQAGLGQPIAYALDGFPLYGLTEPDGTPVTGLDQLNGHSDSSGHYHYHATNSYPYINGGLRGQVTVRDDQVEPQPVTTPVRPSLQPLRGATITGFTVNGDQYSLQYQRNGKIYSVNYRVKDGIYTFTYIDPSGNASTQTY